jgi:hypothetical protein
MENQRIPLDTEDKEKIIISLGKNIVGLCFLRTLVVHDVNREEAQEIAAKAIETLKVARGEAA